MSAGRLTPLVDRLRAGWLARQPRERRALTVLAGALALLLLAQGAWSLEQARQAAQRQAPRLAAEAERMRALAGEWQTLAADSAAPAVQAPVLRQSIDRQIGELGRDISARWLADGELQLQGQVDFATWIRWSAAMQQQNRLVAERIHVIAAPPGVRIEASYRLVAGR